MATYRDAGVDIFKENEIIRSLSSHITYRRRGFGRPIGDIGHYAGLIDLGSLILAFTTDGVGSKILVAEELGKWDTIGIDCIAMNVNDLLAVGAEPLAFVDYLAMERGDENIAAEIGKGLNEGARLSNISIVGGETATLPEIINGMDLAGSALGVIQGKERIITGDRIEKGDAIIGVPSSGIHSNGLTLARKVIEDAGYSYNDPFPPDPSKTIGEELLIPTKIYIEVVDLIKACDVHGLAHITGSGLLKLKRLTDLEFEITDPLPPQPIFEFLQETGRIEDDEMYRTFNMGMGFLAVVDEADARKACEILGGEVVGRVRG
ncbi:MAG: phosphoribosylformylglycinamidine cyclo-ligase [Candidatus Syntrophoarchaeum sp.]|nr:phosphoribosylformylglycinamidine cyclo-ligase [Candidatus Syntrophoarchaeum sp.]